MTEPGTTAQVRVGQVWETRYGTFLIEGIEDRPAEQGFVVGTWENGEADSLRLNTLLGGEFTLVKEAPE